MPSWEKAHLLNSVVTDLTWQILFLDPCIITSPQSSFISLWKKTQPGTGSHMIHMIQGLLSWLGLAISTFRCFFKGALATGPVPWTVKPGVLLWLSYPNQVYHPKTSVKFFSSVTLRFLTCIFWYLLNFLFLVPCDLLQKMQWKKTDLKVFARIHFWNTALSSFLKSVIHGTSTNCTQNLEIVQRSKCIQIRWGSNWPCTACRKIPWHFDKDVMAVMAQKISTLIQGASSSLEVVIQFMPFSESMDPIPNQPQAITCSKSIMPIMINTKLNWMDATCQNVNSCQFPFIRSESDSSILPVEPHEAVAEVSRIGNV